jgi:hypothetical protein
MSEQPICPCEGFDHPKLISNPPGRDVIEYRVGDFTTFRHALLLARIDEKELPNTWIPSAQGDLALQMVEWWAYLADILTFYNERIANEAYLRTADLPESVKRLINVLGYRPRPGIGARGLVAALLNTQTETTLPAGFQIQSKPGPGKQPQIFELGKETKLAAPDVVAVDPPPAAGEITSGSLLVKGTISSVKVGDQLLVLARSWNGSDDYAIGSVTDVKPEKDPRGKTNTRVVMDYARSGLKSDSATSYRLLRSTQSAHLWPYATASDAVVMGSNNIELDSLARQIQAGDPILIDPGNAAPIFGRLGLEVSTEVFTESAVELMSGPQSLSAFFGAEEADIEIISGGQATVGPFQGFIGPLSTPQLVSVTDYSEQIWNANTANPADPTKPPADPTTTPPIAILHSSLTFTPELDGTLNRKRVVIRYAWQDVGQLIATAAKSFITTANTLTAVSPATFASAAAAPVIIEDANGKGVPGTGSTSGTPATSLQIFNLPTPPLTLATPLRALFDLLSVTRGKTVPTEILGSGDATVAGQEFVLKKSPLTYLLSDSSSSDVNYKSTLRVWVDGLEWTEAASFYDQSPDAQVFVTREDEDNKTHVLFGDGINGARLSSGINNVTSSYRYGSGAESPAAGSLTVILNPQPNLKAIRNPVPAGGGADPDPPEQIQRYAPRSVLTFGRAVSADDYETIAAQTPGVARARSYWTFDAGQQRSLVKVYVGDDDNAKSAAEMALAGAADPNRPISVVTATLIPIKLSLSIKMDPRRLAADVIASVRTALIDPDAGLFGRNVVRIGQFVYHSQICAACLSVPGVLAVHAMVFLAQKGNDFAFDPPDFRHDPGEGGFFQLLDQNLNVSTEGPENAG